MELASLDANVMDRERRIAELEAAAKQRTDLIERRTREVDALNRNIEKTVAARGPEVHTGTCPGTHSDGLPGNACCADSQHMCAARICTRRKLEEARSSHSGGKTSAGALFFHEVCHRVLKSREFIWNHRQAAVP